MTQKSILKKVRVRRPRPPEPTPKEKEAWQAFLKMAEELQGDGKALNPFVAAEIERLAAKGNPLAIRLKERLSAASFKPREASEQPKAPPYPRRISAMRWGRPDSKKHLRASRD